MMQLLWLVKRNNYQAISIDMVFNLLNSISKLPIIFHTAKYIFDALHGCLCLTRTYHTALHRFNNLLYI
jgi:hypothetical protein